MTKTHRPAERNPHETRCPWLALALLALLLPGCGSLPAAGPEREALVAQLTTQSDRWDKAIVRKDRAAIANNMAVDFRQIDGYGNVSNKESFLKDLTAPDLTIDPYTVEDFDVRIYGNVALLSGRSRLTGREAGKRFVSSYRYIDIYVHRDGAWKVVSVQISKIPQ